MLLTVHLCTGWYAHSRPEPLYFWFYFIFVNGIWLVIPGWITFYCFKVLNNAVSGYGILPRCILSARNVILNLVICVGVLRLLRRVLDKT
jgi:hypothetical protein